MENFGEEKDTYIPRSSFNGFLMTVGSSMYFVLHGVDFLSVLFFFFSQASSAEIPEETETERVCKHGIPLTGVYGDPHEVNCVRCERPSSRGGRALAGLIAFRRSQSKKRKAERLLNKHRLTAEQDKRKKTIEEYDEALRQFAERHQNNDS